MSSFKGGYLTTVYVVGAILAVVSGDAGAQSYPKLLANGNGLALSRFAVDEQSGSSWITAASYKNGSNYRITVRFTNFYPQPLQQVAYDRCHVLKIIDLGFEVMLSGTFYPSSSYSGAGTAGRYYLTSDPTPLLYGQSRSYQVYFKWSGPSVPTSTYNHLVNFWGGEVCILPQLTQAGLIRQTP